MAFIRSDQWLSLSSAACVKLGDAALAQEAGKSLTETGPVASAEPEPLPEEVSHDSSASDDPSEDDGEGEWITPKTSALHKAKALNLVSSTSQNQAAPPPSVACMTADFAMQNVLLQMNLGLVDIDGRRISSVKNWVLRCHACFK